MTQRVDVDGGVDGVEAYLRERGMTDGLPIVPPTPERVAAAVAASGLAADHVVSDIPPLNAPATVEKIAVNAVMAGCSPEAMPVLISAIEAFCDPQMNAHGVQTTTNPVGPMLVVNGPIRNRLGFNYGAGCFGPGSHTNATVGRALRLALVNIGGAIPGDVDKAPLGWPGKATSLCVAENEEASPWPPYHVDMGFDADDDVVTVLAVNGMWPITDMHHEADQVLHHVTRGLAISGPCGGHDAPNPFPTVLVMSPVIAEMVASLMPTKQELQEHLFAEARVPLDFYPPYRHQPTRDVLEGLGVAVENDRVPIVLAPDHFVILVAGGAGGLQSAGLSCMLGMPTSRAIAAG
ncbi:MAG: hypothetical protein F4Y28_13965 [Acidimicrobiia bacterium]|nr:hypothetical protein [Acidimicrobiia bacterium]MYG59948.1 hypothetical protein [Acidimicrobiia bacterium]MYJ31124.1 hypothetical protein [Acidimicrobiia bacterium]